MSTSSELNMGAKFFSREKKSLAELPPDHEFTRSEVFTSVEAGTDILKNQAQEIVAVHSDISDIFDAWETGRALTPAEETALHNLSDDDKEVLSDYKDLLFAKKRSINNRTGDTDTTHDTFELNVNGDVFTEGVPVDGLMNALKREIDSVKRQPLTTTFTATDRDRKLLELHKTGRTLYKNSKKHPLCPGKKAASKANIVKRVRTEAYLRSLDTLKKGLDDTDNWYNAIHALNAARVLKLPSQPSSTTTLPPPVSPTTSTTSPAPVTPQIPANNSSTSTTTVPIPNTPPTPPELSIGVAGRKADTEKWAAEQADKLIREEYNKTPWYKFFRKARLHMFEDLYRNKIKDRIIQASEKNNHAYMRMEVTFKAFKKIEITESSQLAGLDAERAEGKASAEQAKHLAELKRQGISLEGQEGETINGEAREAFVKNIINPLVQELEGLYDGNRGDFNALKSSAEASERRREWDMKVQQKLADLMKNIDDNTLNLPDNVRDTLRKYFGKDTNNSGKIQERFGTDMLDTLLQVVELNRKNRAVHGFAINELIAGTKINIANARWGAETSAQMNILDKAIKWSQQGHIRSLLLRPGVISAGYFSFKMVGRSLLGLGLKANKMSGPIGGLITGGTFSAIRRNMELKQDRKMHIVEKTYGMDVPDDAKRREAMDRFTYKMASVDELISGTGQNELMGRQRDRSITDLISILSNPGSSATELSQAKQELSARTLEITERLDYSVKEKKDVIKFSNREKAAQERMQLLKAVAEANIALRNAGVTDMGKEIIRAALGGDRVWTDVLREDATAKDRAFNLYKFNQNVKAGIVGMATGFTMGVASQEVVAGVARGLEKLGMDFVKPLTGPTLAERTIDYVQGENYSSLSEVAFGPKATMDNFKDLYEGKQSSIELHNNMHITVNPDHSVVFLDANNQPLANAPTAFLESNGNIIIADPNINPDVRNALGGGWEIGTTKSHSPHEVMRQAVLGKKGEIQWGTVKMNFDENGNVEVTNKAGEILHGKLIKDASVGTAYLDFAGADNAQLEQFNQELSANGFATSPVAETAITGGSVGDKLKDAIAHGGGEVKLPNGVKIEVFANGDITVHANGALLEGSVDKANGVVSFEKGTTLDTGTKDVLQKAGFTIDTQKVVDLKTVSGENVFDELKKENLTTKIHHTEYYTYDTKVSDYNELDLHTYKNGNQLVLSMVEMDQDSFAKGITPGSVDVPDVIKDGNGVMAFKMPGHMDEPILVKVPTSGHLILDTTDTTNQVEFVNGQKMTVAEFSNYVVNKDYLATLPDGDIATEVNADKGYRNVFKIGLDGKKGVIHAGLMDPVPDDAAGGEPVYHSLATIVGEGEADVKIPIEIDELKLVPVDKQPAFTLTGAPFAWELVPPGDEPPLIPIPVVPRWQLEDIKRSIDRNNPVALYSQYNENYGGSEVSLLLRSRRSGTLRRDPNAKLKLQQEADSYFSNQEAQYRLEIENLANQINIPVSNNLEAVICIPVADHQEGSSIYDSLKSYTNQTISKDKYEIILFLNHPVTDRSGNIINPDNTQSEINRFMADYPDMPIRVVGKTMQLEQAKIGLVRKYLNDIALMRVRNLGTNGDNVIFISNDADNKGIKPSYIETFVNKLGKKDNIDGMLGQLDWDPEGYAEYPLVHLGTRYFQYLDRLQSKTSGRFGSSGANFAFKASIYAGVGGYLPDADVAEDVLFGRAIREARNNNNVLQYAGSGTRLYTSARRAINKFLNQNLAPAEQWSSGFSSFDDEIRRFQLGSSTNIDYDDPEQVENLKKGLENIIIRTNKTYRVDAEPQIYEKALRYLGIKIKYDADGKISVTNINEIVNKLKHYKKIGKLQRDIKSGIATPVERAEFSRMQKEYELSLNS